MQAYIPQPDTGMQLPQICDDQIEMTTTSLLTLNRPDLLCQSTATPTFPVLNPADGSLIASVPNCTAQHATAAVDAAAAALPAWRARTAKERSTLLKAWYALVMHHQEDLAKIISLEMGKPLAESRGEIAFGASFLEWFAEEAKRAYGEIIPENARGRKLLATREPVGVVAAITPWNFPFAMLARKAAPALAAGCTLVAKPAEDTPLSALALAFLAIEAGIPAGVINIVTASRENTPQVADAWLADSRVRKISFTGSTAVGKHLMRGAADTVKRISLELGGNAPFIVFDDADLDAAVAGAITAKYRNTGQTCICANRIFIQAGIYDQFAEKFTAAVSKLRVGAAADGIAEQGPLINQRALAKVEAQLADAKAKGGRVLIGGNRHALGHTFFQPTVVADATVDMKFASEETFGPLAPLFKFETEEQVIAWANDTPFGLAAYFYSRDIGRVWRVSAALEAGMIGVNESLISTEVAPFGGIKESGMGREGAREGLNDYMHTKYICMGGLS